MKKERKVRVANANGLRREEKYIRRQRSERSGGAKDEVTVEGPLALIVIYFWLSVRFLEEIQPHPSTYLLLLIKSVCLEECIDFKNRKAISYLFPFFCISPSSSSNFHPPLPLFPLFTSLFSFPTPIYLIHLLPSSYSSSSSLSDSMTAAPAPLTPWTSLCESKKTATVGSSGRGTWRISTRLREAAGASSQPRGGDFLP